MVSTMKDLIIIGLALGAAYLLFANKSQDSQGQPAPSGSPQGFLGNPVNIYTTGYNPNEIKTANDNTTVTSTNPNTEVSSRHSSSKITTSKATAKIVQDVFNMPKSLSGSKGVPYGTGEDIAVAQNFARGLIGTKNSQGGYTYRL